MPADAQELKDAVCNIIQIIKQIPELGETKLKVTGGLALRHHLDQHQPVGRIDFVADLPVSLESFKEKLLEHPLSPLSQDKRILFYQSPAGRKIPIKISRQLYCNQVELPFIHDIKYGVVPYITKQELDRLYPNPSRSSASDVRKRQCDAENAATLKSRHTVGPRSRQLSDENVTKQSAVLSSLQDVIAENAKNDGGRATHRRARSDPGLCSPSVMMTKE
ncbi:hypothetical protein F4801DRAFT_596371 [Xylaria longipes]|nr:hypothetical protein F4801DRAFT_596371 [Xylaria longipes]